MAMVSSGRRKELENREYSMDIDNWSTAQPFYGATGRLGLLNGGNHAGAALSGQGKVEEQGSSL
jgi:hypothetical protein